MSINFLKANGLLTYGEKPVDIIGLLREVPE